MSKYKYVMTNRILNRLINSRRIHNMTARKNHMISEIPKCGLCNKEVKVDDYVESVSYRHYSNIHHVECLEKSRI